MIPTLDHVRLLSRAVEQAPVSIVLTDFDGNIVYVNPTFERITGYAAAEVLGQNPRILASGGTARETYEEMWHSILAGRTWVGELSNQRKDGSPLWERATISAVLDDEGAIRHFVAVKEDITSQRALSQELEDRARQLGDVQTLARVGAWRVEFPSRQVWRSQAIYDAFHVTRATMPETLDGFMSRLHDDDRPRFELAFTECVNASGWLDATLRLRGDDGIERTIHVHGRADRLADGTLTGVVGAAQDVTELYTALRALGALNEDLERRVAQRTEQLEEATSRLEDSAEELSVLNAELARAARAKDEFLASMSHELRTPLTSVLNLSEAMQEGAFGDISGEQGDVLQTVQDAGRHLLNLINDILDLSKIEAGQLTLDVQECLAQDIARASAELTKGMLAKKSQHFTITLPPQPVLLEGDPRRLKQILVNLLSNACKFTPDGGHIGLRLDADEGRGEVRFVVTDDGIGIEPHDFGKLFHAFTQLDSKLSRHHTGTGLGLALVSRMAEMHGGGVRLESQPGVGSTFTVALPWKHRAAPQGEPSAPVATPAVTDRGERLLIVDDNEPNLMILSRYLRLRGFRTLQARNGVEALQMAVDQRPDLILMDIQMPDVDGLEATRHLRSHEDPRVARIPVIAVTALVMPGDREACLAAGANAYVSKPSPLSELLAAIDRCLAEASPTPQ